MGVKKGMIPCLPIKGFFTSSIVLNAVYKEVCIDA